MTDLASVLPVVLIGLLQWLMPALVPPTIPFGVRVPRDRADAPVVATERRRYRLATAGVTAAVTAGALVAGPARFRPPGDLADLRRHRRAGPHQRADSVAHPRRAIDLYSR
jgi:hypothetical protein